jgi:hypothetical protein
MMERRVSVEICWVVLMTSSGNVQVHLMTPPSAPARKDCPVLEDEIVATRSFSVSVGIGRQGCCCQGFNWALSGLMVVVHKHAAVIFIRGPTTSSIYKSEFEAPAVKVINSMFRLLVLQY